MTRRLKKSIKSFLGRIGWLSLELAAALAAFFTALVTFGFITNMVFLEKRQKFDKDVFRLLKKHVNNVNTDVMQFFSFLGSHYFLIPANIVLILYFLLIKKRWFSIKIPVISLSSLVLMLVLKQFFHRERPLAPLLEKAKGLSFPSGHALMSFTFYGLLIYISSKRVENKVARYSFALVLLFVIFFIGLSRIYLRLHYASDVVAGFSLGLLWLVLSLAVLNEIERINKKELLLTIEK